MRNLRGVLALIVLCGVACPAVARGGDEGAVIGHKALAEFAGRFASGPGKGTIRHWDQRILITPTAEGAKGQCYYFSVNPTARPLVVSGAGVYDDDLVKTPQGWKFNVRTFKSDPTAAPSRTPGR